MKINFDFLYIDKDYNYFRSPLMPGYVADVVAHLRNEPYSKLIERLPLDMGMSFEYSIQDDTILFDLISRYIAYMDFDPQKFLLDASIVYLGTESEFVHFSEYSFQIKKLFKYYPSLEELNLFFAFFLLQGEIWRDGNVKYYMNSHEEGHHHRPHIHVDVDHEYTAAIDIMDQVILAGKLPPKYKTKILEKVGENKQYLLDCWNKTTDGLIVDINYGLGITRFLGEKTP